MPHVIPLLANDPSISHEQFKVQNSSLLGATLWPHKLNY